MKNLPKKYIDTSHLFNSKNPNYKIYFFLKIFEQNLKEYLPLELLQLK